MSIECANEYLFRAKDRVTKAMLYSEHMHGSKLICINDAITLLMRAQQEIIRNHAGITPLNNTNERKT
jgi:hypothetical protein